MLIYACAQEVRELPGLLFSWWAGDNLPRCPQCGGEMLVADPDVKIWHLPSGN